MPNRFTPINNQASLSKSMQTINKNFMMLDAETYSKTIQKGGQTQMVSGKLPNGRYGELFYDENGVPQDQAALPSGILLKDLQAILFSPDSVLYMSLP